LGALEGQKLIRIQSFKKRVKSPFSQIPFVEFFASN